MKVRRFSRRLTSLCLAAGLLSATSVVHGAAGADPDVAPASPASTDVSSPLRVMPLGDSVTLGNSPERSYRGYLQTQLQAAGLHVDFVGNYGNIIPPGGEAIWFGPDGSQSSYGGPFDKDFEGHGGFQAGQPESVVGYKDHMLAQMIPVDLPLFQPDVVLVHIGTNDWLGGFTIHGPWHGPAGPEDRRYEFAARNVIDLIDAINTIRPEAMVLVSPIGKAGLNDLQNGLAEISTVVRAAVLQRAAQGHPVQYVDDVYAGFTAADLADEIHPNDAGYAKMAGAWFRALSPVLHALGRRAATAPATTCPEPTAVGQRPAA